MKRKIIFGAVLTCAVLVSCFAVSAIAERVDERPKNEPASSVSSVAPMTTEGLTKTDTFVRDYGTKTNPSKTKASGNQLQDTITAYIDESGNKYEFNSRGQVIVYDNPNAETNSANIANTLAQKDVESYISQNELVLSMIPNYSEYDLVSLGPIIFDVGYEAVLHRTIAKDVVDQAIISVLKDGTISHITLHPCNLEGLTDEQRNQLEGQLDAQLASLSDEYDSYEISGAFYRSYGGEIAGIYHVMFFGDFPGDDMPVSYGERFIFTIPA